MPTPKAEDQSQNRKLPLNLADFQVGKPRVRPLEGGLTVACPNDEALFGKERDLISKRTCLLFVVYGSSTTGLQQIIFTAELLL